MPTPAKQDQNTQSKKREGNKIKKLEKKKP
jgi:hypothetical protein